MQYPCYKSVYNIGYLDIGEYKAHINRVPTIQYKTWKSMLSRCYNPQVIKKYPTYKDCIVCEEWCSFQNFSQWFDKNYYTIDNEKMCLDKDILIKGNKIYSPNTCVFVPEKINNLFAKRNKVRGEYPIGVYWHKTNNKFISRFNKLNQLNHLGCFDAPEEAFYAYKIAKEEYIKEIADEYKNRIPLKLYEAMYNYIVEIND